LFCVSARNDQKTFLAEKKPEGLGRNPFVPCLPSVADSLLPSNSNLARLKDYKISVKIFLGEGIKGFDDLIVQL
jgi:hypothetical protein